MEAAWWWWWLGILLKGLLGTTFLALAGFVGLPLVLAAITVCRGNCPSSQKKPILSSLYVGRVWHTRFLPKHHAFQYPLFLFALDLEEVDDLFSDQLWPLSLLVKFRNIDHLKNGEGKEEESIHHDDDDDGGVVVAERRHEIAHRVLRLVAEKTKNSFQPTLETHRVILVTHLCYYGYCFNPVSFYYVQEKQKSASNNSLVAVVGEVSNTPWNEMHCYVLHPESTDNVKVKVKVKKNRVDNNDSSVINYQFPKRFHVSPFMEMTFIYDWTFTNFQLDNNNQSNSSSTTTTNNNDEDDQHHATNGDPLRVVTIMKKRGDDKEEDDKVHFAAKFECFHCGLTPTRVAYQLIQYPIYCAIIQIWIHYEAFWLFVKGIVFVPHPKDSNTTASRIIGSIMTPLFALKDFWVEQTRMTSSNVNNNNKAATSNSLDDPSGSKNNKPKTN
jgi:uncharacterized protein